MGMRITDSILYRTTLSDTAYARLRLARAQQQASSGLRINDLADDPVGVRAATLLKAGLETTGQFMRNIAQARSRISEVEASLQDTYDLLSQAKVTAMAGRNGTIGQEGRRILAAEVKQLHARLLSNGNRRASGGFIFSGYTSDVQPFTRSGPFADGSPAPTVSFGGDVNEVGIDIDDGVQIRSTLNGQRVFMGDADGDGSADAGRENLFDVLADLYDALSSDDEGVIGAALTRLDVGMLQVSVERADIGAVDTKLERFQQRLELREVDLAERLSDVQDADSVAVFSDLVNQETALRASLEATARLLQPNLMDFLG